jgi:hypothetical protein
LIDDMARPFEGVGTRYFGLSPRGEIAFPMTELQSLRQTNVKRGAAAATFHQKTEIKIGREEAPLIFRWSEPG